MNKPKGHSFLLKSEESKEVARLASEKGYYNSATSRCYYSVYLKLTYILKKDNVTLIPKSKDMGSHERTILSFASHYSPYYEGTTRIKGLITQLKTKRKVADYKEWVISEAEYSKIINMYNEVNMFISKI